MMKAETERYGGIRQAALPAALLLLALLITGQTVSAQTSRVETGPLEELRQEALSLVNDARRENELEVLELAAPLNAAAQDHAEDMLARGYYSHVSPEGKDVQDRYLEHGGSRWRFIAENIATCESCPTPPDPERVQRFHEGWMESPEHRQNILAGGLDAFGFGIAAGNGQIYAVQTFAGAGTTPGSQAGNEALPLLPEAQVSEAVAAVNRAREREDLRPLEPSDALTIVAEQALASGRGSQLVDSSTDLFELLPEDGADWRALNVVAAACGGCGATPNTADLKHFTDRWLDNPEYREALLSGEATHLGFTLNANGEGRKTAVAVIGERR